MPEVNELKDSHWLRSTRLGELGKIMVNERGTHLQRGTAKHATGQQSSSAKDGPNTSNEYNTVDQNHGSPSIKKKFSLCVTSHGIRRRALTASFKHTQRCGRQTHTHVQIGRDFNAQVGVNNGPSTPNTTQEALWTCNTAEDSGSGTGQSNTSWHRQKHVLQKQEYNKATCHSTTHCKRPDDILINRALFKHCNAETTGQIDMNADHKSVIARINQFRSAVVASSLLLCFLLR